MGPGEPVHSSGAPSTSTSPYRRSDLHGRTLDIIASVRGFESLSSKELADFLQLAQSESPGCGLDEALRLLARRYGWDTSTRMEDVRRVWIDVMEAQAPSARLMDSDDETVEDDIDGDDGGSDDGIKKSSIRIKEGNKNQDSNLRLGIDKLPVVMKRDASTRPFLLCEVRDPVLALDGDSGAIGRFSVGPDQLYLDIKGRQYSGHIFAGPTVLLLNIAPAVGQTQATTVARVEAISSEYCRLEFERDLMQDLVGHYSGDASASGAPGAGVGGGPGGDSEGEGEYEDAPRSKAARASKALKYSKTTVSKKSANSRETKAREKPVNETNVQGYAKKRKRMDDASCSGSDGSAAAGSEEEDDSVENPVDGPGRRPNQSKNPKISTVTNRRRGGGGKSKVGKGKKKLKK